MSISPIEDILIKYSEYYPISMTGIINLIDKLDEIRKYPENLQLEASRYPLRIIHALIPDFDDVPINLLANTCNFPNLEKDIQLPLCIYGIGKWHNENDPESIRKMLNDIKYGSHPEDARDRHNIRIDCYKMIDSILNLEDYWSECILVRILDVRSKYKGILKWIYIIHELRTIKPNIIFSWNREAKNIEKQVKNLLK